MKKILCYIILSLLLINCTSLNNSKNDEIDLKELSEKLFKEYSFSYETLRKKSSTQLVVWKISKENFSNNDYEKIKKALLADKWSLIDSYNNYYSFCKTNDYSVDILNPIYSKHYSRDGDEVNFTSNDYWYFAFYYNKLGINTCMEYYRN